MTSQLTGSDEREKRKKRVSMDRRGLHGGRGLTVCTVCMKTKVERGKWETTFPTPLYCPPIWLRGPLPFGLYPHALHSFVLQLPSPSCCVWCQLDKFSFFFSPFISNLCRTMSTAISPSPPPLLTRTQAIPRRRRHQPPSLPPQHLLPHQSRSRYNRHRATPCTDPHMRRGAHIGHPAVVALTVRIFF